MVSDRTRWGKWYPHILIGYYTPTVTNSSSLHHYRAQTEVWPDPRDKDELQVCPVW